MNTNELNSLLAKNDERIKAIHERYSEKAENIQSYHDLVIELKENWETKEKFKDNSQINPSLTPNWKKVCVFFYMGPSN